MGSERGQDDRNRLLIAAVDEHDVAMSLQDHDALLERRPNAIIRNGLGNCADTFLNKLALALLIDGAHADQEPFEITAWLRPLPILRDDAIARMLVAVMEMLVLASEVSIRRILSIAVSSSPLSTAGVTSMWNWAPSA
ncbi:hypothetical protein CWO89_35675 [Bradyrhizobium sp. Leo170]|nr:hypothetical protein CWO89_35675 [Bradyrhizobium sp. Leo170]